MSSIDYLRLYVKQNFYQFLRFGIVGGSTMLLNLGVFHLFFSTLEIDYRVALTMAYVLSIVMHYILSRFFTYKSTSVLTGYSMASYIILLLINYGIAFCATWLAKEVLGLMPHYGIILSACITVFISYFYMKYVVFSESVQC